MMKKVSDGKAKWRLGLDKIRRQSTISEPSVTDSPRIMDEENSELEMQDYFARLKKKTGLNNLWSGRKFMETIDKDPDIDMLEEPKINRREFALDSDEEDLHKFIQNLSDDERSIISAKESESSKAVSSNSEIDLLKNINFAEPGEGDYKLDEIESDADAATDDDKDYMPVVMRPTFDDQNEENGDSDDTDSYQSNIFKNKSINLMNSEISSMNSSPKKIENDVNEHIASDLDGTVSELSEEIPEVNEESRVKTPATLGKSHDYTTSKFESYESSNEISLRSKSGRKKERIKSSLKDSEQSHSSHSRNHKDRSNERRKGKGASKNASISSSSQMSSSTQSSSRTKNSHLCSSFSGYSSSSSESPSSSSAKAKHSVGYSKSKRKHESSGKSKSKENRKSSKVSNGMKMMGMKVGLSDLGTINQEMLRNYDVASKYLDPSPIATNVVDDEVLEAVASYNPTMIALNDLLKYQLQLTRQHIDNSWRLYNAYAQPEVKGKHKYTTLKNTMKYMRKNAPSVITYEEALKQIKNQSD